MKLDNQIRYWAQLVNESEEIDNNQIKMASYNTLKLFDKDMFATKTCKGLTKDIQSLMKNDMAKNGLRGLKIECVFFPPSHKGGFYYDRIQRGVIGKIFLTASSSGIFQIKGLDDIVEKDIPIIENMLKERLQDESIRIFPDDKNDVMERQIAFMITDGDFNT